MLTSTVVAEESTRPLNPSPAVPQPGRHRRPMTVVKPQTSNAWKRRKILVTVLTVLVILGIMVTVGYFVKQLIDSKYFFCPSSVKFIPLEQACDGKNDCANGEDELSCLSRFIVNTTFPVRLMSDQNVLQVYSPASGWGTVCSDGWTAQHTQTACTQLGYTINPTSTNIQVSNLASLKFGSFTAVKPGITNTPIQEATTAIKACDSGSIISLTCSDCGLETVSSDRIVGGVNAKIEEWPWQVSLQHNGQHTCGGSLVSPQWVVTAAHCFSSTKKELSRWRVMSGQTYLTTLGGSYVDRIIVNGQYATKENDYDIALMKLSSPIKVGVKSKPVCLPPKSLNVPDNFPLAVTGWGLLKENGVVSDTLQVAHISLIGRSTCASPAIYGSHITQRMICAGSMKGGVDACQGDSGGPLTYFSSQWNLIGVVSWGVGCAEANRPGVYTNMDEMLNWIYTFIEKNS
ncbi:transmembrane protease serine 4a isoform X2 [Nothobranchius furzeri]|uniref:Transmembrane protease serine 4-like n=1 Tax=Nothobranchius furzeri TaxID=105023 RepID=A0A8C6M8M4_NOTFU|nr:transmembrane protease serine 4a isoform X1 [Nothobranchius furzeri]